MADKNAPDNDDKFDPPRRSFFVRFSTLIMAASLLLAPCAAAIAFLFDPLLRKQKAAGGDDGFVKLPLSPDLVPADGTPILVTIKADRFDAWNFYPDQEIGTVWVRRENGSIAVTSTICPHLGCAVDYRRAENDFFCPCHNSEFDLTGKPLNQIPPRAMDQLQIKEEAGYLWVKYQKFRGGIKEKIPV